MRLRGNNVPRVDILITCCGEDDTLIVNTARAACNIDYPVNRFRVIVLDDGQSDSLFRAVAALHEQCPNLFYRSREKNTATPHHFKAGNLNFGLRQTQSVKGEVGEYVAALDADMIPEPEWLRAMLPHMLLDARCGLACPPQVIYLILNTFYHKTNSIRSSSIMFHRATLCTKVSTFSFTCLSPSRTPWASLGALDQATSSVAAL